MSTAHLSSTTPDLPDRSARLMFFGIFQILIGCLCGLMGLMMAVLPLLGQMAKAPQCQTPQCQAMNAQMMIPCMVFYLVLAVAFIWLGVGSIRARRWAWTLTVVLSWMWLIMGVAGFVMGVLFMGPAMSASMEQQAKVPPEAIVAIRIIGGAVLACIYIFLPALFLLFYHRQSVRATCQRRDPQIRWTDRCPMPVLALSILHASSAAMWMPAMAAYGWVMPVFGIILSGAAGAAVILSLSLVMAYLAWGTYRLQMAAWWGTLLLWIVGILNMVAFSQTGLMEMYERMRMPAAQLEMMRKSGMIETMSRWMPAMGMVGGGLWLGYLLYVRRYFGGRSGGQPPGAARPML